MSTEVPSPSTDMAFKGMAPAQSAAGGAGRHRLDPEPDRGGLWSGQRNSVFVNSATDYCDERTA